MIEQKTGDQTKCFLLQKAPAGKDMWCPALSYIDKIDELRNVYVSQITHIVELYVWGLLSDQIYEGDIFKGYGLHGGGGSADINNMNECM